MDKITIQNLSHGKILLILFVLSIVLLMLGNNLVDLTDPDEVFYMQTAKEMIQSNDWITPRIFGEPQFEKPIGFYYLLAIAIKLFGLTPFAARFWPAIFGVIGVLATYWIAWMLFEKKRLAFLSALILASSFIYLALSRSCLTDMVFSILVTIAIGFFYLSYKDKKKRDLGVILCSTVCGLAILTKGLLGFTFVVGTALIFLVLTKDLSGYLKNKILWLGFILVLAIAIPWHWTMFKLFKSTFLDVYFGNVHFRRLFVSEHPRINTWYFYLSLMFAGTTPWSLLSLPAWGSFFRKIFDMKKRTKELLFLLSWVIGIYIFVQPAQAKLSSYIFPAFPAIAIIIAVYLNGFLEDKVKENKYPAIFAFSSLLALALAAVPLVVLFMKKTILEFAKGMSLVYLASILAVLLAAIMAIFIVRKKYAKLIYAHSLVTFLFLTILLFSKSYIEPWVSCRLISDELNKIDKSDSVVLASKFYVRGVRFYTDRKMAVIDIGGKGFYTAHPIPFLNDDQKVIEFILSQEETYAILKEGNVEDIKRILKNMPYTIEEIEYIGGRYLLRIEKIKDLKNYII